MIRWILVFVIIVETSRAALLPSHLQHEWNMFELMYKKKYERLGEGKFRLKIFSENLKKISKHNAKYERGEVSFKLGMNQFGDMMMAEFSDTVLGYNHTRNENMYNHYVNNGSTFICPVNVHLPKEIDWREFGAVTRVKNQEYCGSCWAFSATGALEGQHFRKTGILTSLSEQNLIDCSFPQGNNGCQGGTIDNAFIYVEDNGGIDPEASYPYQGKVEECRYKPLNSAATSTGFVHISAGSEENLEVAIATIGPVSASIDAHHDSFVFYKRGIYHNRECSRTRLNHDVLVVGYGSTHDGAEYWLLKNSWGTHWGEHGFMKLARNTGNQCGIASRARYPLV